MGEREAQRIGPYTVVAGLGEGGMGAVYLARDARRRPVAVKVLRPELARDPGMVRRFRREADTASAVRGRGVARLLGHDLDGPLPWIAAEFLAGPTLHEAVGLCGTFDEAGARALGARLARALTVIHGAGLVHRDLKPSNIVLTHDGPRVIDFGIARPEHGLTLTDPGTAPATPGYAPPEQVTGRRSGPPADVFALGAVLVFACTGRAPFGSGHPAAVNFRVVHENPDLDGVPPALTALLRDCLAKAPGARPAPGTLARLLGRTGHSGRAARAGRTERGEQAARAELPWRRAPLREEIERRTRQAEQAIAEAGQTDEGSRSPGRSVSRRTVLAASGTAVLAAGGGVLAWWLRRERPTGPEVSESGVPYAEPLADPQVGSVPDPLWTAEGIAPDGPGPLAVDRVVVAPAGGGLAAWRQDTGAPAWSWPGRGAPERRGPLLAVGRTLYVVTPGGRLTALDARSGEAAWDTTEAEALQALAADRAQVYVLDAQRRVAAVALSTREVRWRSAETVASEGPVGAAVADGRLLVCAREGQGVAFDLLTGEVCWRKDFGPVAPYLADTGLTPAVHGDAFCVGGARLAVVRARDGKERWAQDDDSEFGERSWGAPAVVGDRLYAPHPWATRRELLCLDMANGSRIWATDVGYAQSFSFDDEVLPVQPPVQEGKALYVPLGVQHRDNEERRHDQGVAALDAASGTKLWVHSDDSGQPGWRLAAAAGRMFVAHGERLRAMPTW
ncbi:PQQ-binding-like beta-propeller repeat protein [Streptomyces sp. TRM66268-LWL]|uniref:PQQ-binding-like beta-propeller repeat protein n=1 Tax=Streptomyces polyasparticus TaxID=2767826 RepID=A0ABR7SBM2_9ACTN|nr:serine/threonine-protein kinase [Streptomyces polyasparticus]MBC9711728.1 PQQ-binding-like beta-propeller repeat protein [Streptomyces polyasparticus]